MIELKFVTKKYAGGHYGMYWENLTIPGGEIVGILGENGSGKTTMLKAIMGIGDLQNGEIRIDGRPVTEQYENMAFITEEGSFLPDRTPYEYADFLEDFFPNFDRKRYDKLLKFFKLERHVAIKKFSKGEKSKLEICAGFSKGAKYILMDEPFLGKDMFTRRDFLKLMVSSLKGDETILITTHIIDEIENVLDRAVILRYGRVKADLYIDDLREQGRSLADVMAEISGYEENKYKEIFE
ncbi:ATP-binding cassette domain-containing protein [Paenibacillus sp. J2TS4]|uniref:ATP-binding cassette domain-containing protein n=1 Tax=Paenibacillus sp. J2TS4 TaxID=2807194 RepID=UPI001B29FE59|nr:ABC transporter ATP-binding protein [Paenibacillus sp. J2TS4]GIP32660.1 multidrug ABC transporter ATP-binding protein [Paenibacillus sp. J2TS4]